MELPVSVVVPVRNGENCVARCMESILKQTFENFELIMVDDASSDNTGKIINGFKDTRIKCIRNKEWLGIAGSRNAGTNIATGKYLFFTDADCVVNPEWIEEGLSCFEKGYVGVEGKIVYVSENYKQSFSDYVMENRYGGKFMTGNVAYLRDAVVAIGGLDESLTYLSDRALGLEVCEKYGKIFFNERMVAIHPWVQMTKQRVFKSISAIDDRMVLYKKYGDRELITWRIMNIRHFVLLLCPALILASFLLNTYKKKTDFQLLPITFIAAIVERVQIWKASTKYHVFII
ncbi:MAG TPA: glycosyltransferase family A protein [Candidatus Acidoferrum sp.]|nr:glycosyltransferase family A protein [Candidatus Acidoferrum sp.]